MKFLLHEENQDAVEVDIVKVDGKYEVTWENQSPIVAEAAQIKDHLLHMFVDGRSVDVPFRMDGNVVELAIDAVPYRYEIMDPRDAAYDKGSGAGQDEGIVAVNMPGKVVQILVSEGDSVVEGQGVIVVEAMKMENELKVTMAGTVLRIAVQPGDAVEAGQVLLEIAAE